MTLKTWLLFLIVLAFPVTAQPTAPELALADTESVTTGRFGFARIPELALIRGIPQTVQMGFYQLDPSNRWPPGDVERKSGWLSNHETRLVVDGGSLPPQITYDDRTGELKYSGTWSGDLTVRLAADGVQSNPFRIRVLTPTVVWGENAASVNSQRQWNATVCPVETTSFSNCRQKFVGGSSDAAPLVIFFTPGTYAGQDYFTTARPFTYLLGDPLTRPTLVNDDITGNKKQMYYVANLNLRNVGIVLAGNLTAPSTIIVRNVYQCCETGDNNGLVNPNGTTGANLWQVYWHQSESKGMGGLGNHRHSAYVEGRPNSIFDVNNVRFLGARGSSAIKTTMNELNIRHSHFQVAESAEDLKNGVCSNGTSTGCLMHTPVDFPGYSSAIIYGNRFLVWRGPTVGVFSGRWGIMAGTIFIRLRQNSLGSDTPNYPNVSWNPPVSSQATKLPPCYAWDGTAATFVADKFWQDVRSKPLKSETNPCTFKHFISYNEFEQLPGSLHVWPLRDDGTYPAAVTSQFAVTVNILRNHPLWAERSTSFMFGNTYTGFDMNRMYELNRNAPTKYIDPLAYWPRQGPDDFPRVVDDLGQELPPWFKL